MEGKKKLFKALILQLWLLYLPLSIFLFVGPFYISCGSSSSSDSSDTEAEVISDFPESIPAPIAKTETEIGVDSSSIETTANSEGGATLTGEIFGDNANATVAMYVNGEPVDSVAASNSQFSFDIPQSRLGIGLSLVVILDGTATNPLVVSPPLVVKLQEVEGNIIRQIAVTNVKQTTTYTDIAAGIQNKEVNIFESVIYFQAVDSNGDSALFLKDISHGGFNRRLVNLENPLNYIQIGLGESLLGTNSTNGLMVEIENFGTLANPNTEGATVTTESSEATSLIPDDRFITQSPDITWRAFTFLDGDSLKIQIASLLDDKSGDLVPSTPENRIFSMSFLFENALNEDKGILLATKQFADRYEIQRISVPAYPQEANQDVNAVIIRVIDTSTNLLGRLYIEKENREEAVYICAGEDGVTDLCVVDLNNWAVSVLIEGDGFNIVKGDYASAENTDIIIEADFDSETFTDNRLYRFNRETATSQFLTFGYNFDINREDGIIAHLLVDREGNPQVGIFVY